VGVPEFLRAAPIPRRKATLRVTQCAVRCSGALISEDPYRKPPPYEKLVGDLAGADSRRINIQHRLVYQVLESERVVKVLRLWSPYE
jgi:Txe/YoeB family toxin of toxin-antitoxin system